ncbi:2-dehydropantoate 2-reductase [Metabacillus crassostreae]|uniref:ketopantoate reductase family protein n=1 Tax=Metabacillus crassostreae TaxID=929098 RepID=UPI00195AFEDD|nr:ketopantoate reductase family protein [Metabacillus crassostreae]MBM7603515.1 2-dehydropantoate 2-reductase [Metabacillus crassostreae]
MKVLVVGAGAVGGYFGGRLAESGVDVTFLVREKRQQQLKENGLKIKSVHGDYSFSPKTIVSTDLSHEKYDVVIIGTKSYHLQNAIEDIKHFVAQETVIIPLLNGIKHIDVLKSTFLENQVIGGLCFVESTVDQDGVIIQSSKTHDFVYGEFTGIETDRIQKINEAFSQTKASIRKSDTILKDMWHKYMFISGLSGITTLFRSSIGPIREAKYGLEMIENLFLEIGSIMRGIGAPIDDHIENLQLHKINEMSYDMKSSMQRDMEKKESIEGEHLHGHLLTLAKENNIHTPYLKMTYSNLSTYNKQHFA